MLDMANPINPVNLGTYQSTGNTLDLSVVGVTAYSASGPEGVEVFDTVSLSQSGLIQYAQNLNDIVTAGDYAYSAADDGFWILDVSDPNTPVPVAHLETSFPAVSLALQGNIVFLACPGDGIHVIDASNPLAPIDIAYFSLSFDLRQLFLVNNILYAAAGADGLHILDSSDPYQLEELGAFTMPDYGINAVAVSGGHAYLAASNDNLIVLDVSDPASPAEIGAYDPPNDLAQWGSAVAVQDNTVLFGTVLPHPTPLAGYDAGDVWIVDVSNPDEPVEVARMSPGEYGWAPWRISMDDGRAFVIYERQGLYIYDFHNPAAVQELGRYDPSEFIYGMTVAGDRIYLYNQSTFILRYPDPALPSISGRVTQTNHLPYPGVKVSAGDTFPEKITDLKGAYTFTGVPDGSYTLVPSLPGYVFSPTSRTVDLPPSAWSQNFTILPEPVSLEFTPGISATVIYTDTQGLPTWLDIPADASGASMTLQVVPTVAEGATGYAFAGHAFELIAGQENTLAPDFTFNSPITVTIQYSVEDTAVVSDIDTLALWWWDGSTWQDAVQSCSPATSYKLDPDNKTLEVPICQTGAYKLMGPTYQVYLPLVTVNQ